MQTVNNNPTPTATTVAIAALVKTLRGYDAKEERIRKGLHYATSNKPKVIRHSESGKWTLVATTKGDDGLVDGYELVFTPTLAGSTEGMTLQERHWLYYFTDGRKGEPHPALNLKDWLEANSLDNLRLPTGAADICFGCGYQDCKCPKNNPRHNPATCDCEYHVALRETPYISRRDDIGKVGYTVGNDPAAHAVPNHGRFIPLLGKYAYRRPNDQPR